MQNITSVSGLKDAIRKLEYERTLKGKILKEQIIIFRESLKPANIIKSTFKDFLSSSDSISNILRTAVVVTSGYLSGKAFTDTSGNRFKKIIKPLIQLGVTILFAKTKEIVISAWQRVTDRRASKI
jgi:hypothetical protein